MIKERDFVIKYTEAGKVGYLKTQYAKFFLGSDGVLSITFRDTYESNLCGVFRDGALEEVPNSYMRFVSPVLEKLTHMHFVLQGRFT